MLTLTSSQKFSKIDSKVLSLKVCIITAMAGKWQLVRGNKRGRMYRMYQGVHDQRYLLWELWPIGTLFFAKIFTKVSSRSFQILHVPISVQDVVSITKGSSILRISVKADGSFPCQRHSEPGRGSHAREGIPQQPTFTVHDDETCSNRKDTPVFREGYFIEMFHPSALRVPRYVTDLGNCLFNSVSGPLWKRKHCMWASSTNLHWACSKLWVLQEPPPVPEFYLCVSWCRGDMPKVHSWSRIFIGFHNASTIICGWSGTIPHLPDRIWTPNHVVPLIQKPDVQSVPQASSPIIGDNPMPDFNTSPFQTTTYSKLDTHCWSSIARAVFGTLNRCANCWELKLSQSWQFQKVSRKRCTLLSTMIRML